jgi:hypothetical protein
VFRQSQLVALVFLTLSPPILAVPTQELVFPHLAVGAGWEAELTLVAQGSEASQGWVYFNDQEGNPLLVNVDGGNAVSEFSYNLARGTSRVFRFTGAPLELLRVGYIVVTQLEEDSRQGSINGLLTFRFLEGTTVHSQIGSLPSPEILNAHLPFNNTAGNRTAFALAAYLATPVHFVWYNQSGTRLATTRRDFAAFHQAALYVDELFPGSVGTRGFIALEGEERFNLLAMEERGGRFSTGGVMPGAIERDLRLQGAGVSNWILRLAPGDGGFLAGVAQRLTPQAGSPAQVSGILTESHTGLLALQLNIHLFTADGERAVNICLLAPVFDFYMEDASGSFVAVQEDGLVLESGRFTLSTPATAQF